MFFFLQTNVKETIEPPIKKLEPKLLPGEFISYIIQKAGDFMQFSVLKFAGLGRYYIKNPFTLLRLLRLGLIIKDIMSVSNWSNKVLSRKIETRHVGLANSTVYVSLSKLK